MTLPFGFGAVRRLLLSSFHTRLAFLENRNPVVSFCFDDFPRTAYTVGGAILKNFGACGTYYAAMGLMNTVNKLGEQFRPSDLDSLMSDGHELACHTFSHISCRKVPFQAFETDVQRGRQAIREATGRDPANFSYPYGHVTLTAKNRIGPQMRSCRGIYGGLNAPQVDLSLLRANSLYGEEDRFAQAKSLLLENERQKSWVIFYTHDVHPRPSPFGCTPSFLEKTVSFAAERGYRILTVNNALDELKTPNCRECVGTH